MIIDNIFILIVLGIFLMLFIWPIIQSIWLYFWASNLWEYYISYDQDQVASYLKRNLHNGKIKRVKDDEYFKKKYNNLQNREDYYEYLRQNR